MITTYTIKPPVWEGGYGAMAEEAVKTPNGWLGYRRHQGGFVMVGQLARGDPLVVYDDDVHQTKEQARERVERKYYRRVREWLVRAGPS